MARRGEYHREYKCECPSLEALVHETSLEKHVDGTVSVDLVAFRERESRVRHREIDIRSVSKLSKQYLMDSAAHQGSPTEKGHTD